MMNTGNIKSRLWILMPLGLSVFIILWLIFSSICELSDIAARARWGYLWLALCASAASYLFIGLSLWETLRLLGHRLPLWETSGVALVSTAANYFVSSAGISGFALRAHLLSKRGVQYGVSVTSSVLITVLLYAVLALIVIQGCVLMLLRSGGTRVQL